jgi:dynein assembly factor 2
MPPPKKEEFTPTQDELKALEQAMKDESFRKLLMEYAEEISNPENRKVEGVIDSRHMRSCR